MSHTNFLLSNSSVATFYLTQLVKSSVYTKAFLLLYSEAFIAGITEFLIKNVKLYSR